MALTRRVVMMVAALFFLVAHGSRTGAASESGHVQPSRSTPALDSTTKLELRNARIQWADYRGRRALKLAPLPGHEHAVNEEMTAILTQSDFKDGTIELDVAGARRAGYSKAEDESGFKGMIGVSFRVQGERAERLYVRPENARLDNQLFRNRTTQYESVPGFAWNQLREEHPGVYESYVDLEPGAWAKLRIEVTGTKARLYVNGATQPSLIVNDLKQGYGHGKIALWSRVSTDAYFSNLRVSGARAHHESRFTEYPTPAPHTDEDSTRTVVPLEGTSGLTLFGTHARAVTYRGLKAVELTQNAAAADSGSLEAMALLERPELKMAPWKFGSPVRVDRARGLVTAASSVWCSAARPMALASRTCTFGRRTAVPTTSCAGTTPSNTPRSRTTHGIACERSHRASMSRTST